MSEETDLIKKYSASRDSIEVYIKEIEGMKKNIEKLFPEKLEQRNRWAFGEKVKATSEFLNVLLRMKQEFHRSIEKEIDIRRKLTMDGKIQGESTDIRDIVSRMEDAGLKLVANDPKKE